MSNRISAATASYARVCRVGVSRLLRVRRFRVGVLAAVTAVTLLLPASSLGVHDLGLFELDTAAPQYANTVDNSGPGAPYDWESIFNSSGQQILTSAAEPRLLTADFSPDYATPDTSYFATSNKDIDDVSTWKCGPVNNPTPKDEITNAYAALFVNTANNHVILYADGERDKNNGNSFMGFWIFKSAVGCNSPGSFSGQHTDGDILVLSNFVGGGVHPLVEVYQWIGGGLSLLGSGNFCHAAAAGDDICGEVNGTPFQTAWAPHDTAANPLDINEFLEVGVDLTSVLSFTPNSIPCFARFLAETRSSQETTATLKDFASGTFNTCTSSTVTTPLAGGSSVSGATVLPGTSVTDRAVVSGSALVGAAPAPTGSVSFFLCGPQATQLLAQCSTGGNPVGSAVSLPPGSANPKTVTSSAVAPTVPGWYCFRAVYSGDANYPDGSFDSSLNECFRVVKATPTVSTDIHNASHQVVTVAAAGSTVHDFVRVAGVAGGPTPGGTVTLSWFTNGTCSGAASSNSASLSLNASGEVDATSFAQGPLAAGLYGFRAHYPGDVVYLAADGPCESLQVVDASIQITPASAINPISTNHVLTAHASVNGGSGFANAPDGTQISFTIDSGPGSFTTPNPCTTSGGSCTITLTSATPGTTVVSAQVTVTVAGISLTRTTNGVGANSSSAVKLFADDTVRTDVLNAAGGVVTSVVAGTVVHDKVFVAAAAGTPAGVPNPTGNVVFHRYATVDCTGTATNQTVALTPGSPSTAVSDDLAPVGNISYLADYSGDANYPARSGACEPLTVTPAAAPAIAIVKNPKSQTVAVGGTATFTITVTNAGNTVLTDVNVVDPLSPNCNRTKAEIPALASMAPGATVTYTCTRPNVRGNFDNLATATGTPPSGPNVTASDTAPVKTRALTPAKKKVVKKQKKKPKVVSHKKPKATG
jgi:uncharacterized repeat protein (TIGR01451 family)